MAYTIRKAAAADAPDLAQVLTQSWWSAYRDLLDDADLARYTDLRQRTQMFQRMLASPRGACFIAFDGEIPCGLFLLGPSCDADFLDHAEIVSFYTLEEYWGKGLAKEMMSAALEAVRRAGYRHVMLWVMQENQRARRFYEKSGFQAGGREKGSSFAGYVVEVRYLYDLAGRGQR